MNRVANCSFRNKISVEKRIAPLVLRTVRHVICWHFFIAYLTARYRGDTSAFYRYQIPNGIHYQSY